MSDNTDSILSNDHSSSAPEEEIARENDLEEGETISDNNATLPPRHSMNQASFSGNLSQLGGGRSNPELKAYFRQESSRLIDQVIASETEAQDITRIDDDRLKKAVNDAGEYAYGISAVETWVMEEGSGQLVRQAWWSKESCDSHKNLSLQRLNDTNDPDYVDRVVPGLDLAGVLFAESSIVVPNASATEERSMKGSIFGRKAGTKKETFQDRMSRSFDPRLLSRSFDPRRVISLFGGNSPNRHNLKSEEEQPGGIIFRDINSLLLDPDTPKTARLALLKEAGYSKAAGVSFQSGWHHGIVIFYISNVKNEEALVSIPNLLYLRRATDLVGTVVASSDARRAAHALCLSEDGPSNAESKLATAERYESMSNNSSNSTCTKKYSQQLNKHMRWWHKCLGSKTSQIPPAMTWNQSAWTLFGSLWGLVWLLGVNEMIRHSTDDQLFFLLGPIGALMTLQYGLTSAPASQPRNAILGQILSGIIVLPFTYIPENILPIWLRQVIAPALANFSMAKVGVIHPPAGGAAMLLASGKFGFEFYGLMVAASVLSIIPCTMINNLSDKRQYPTYWGYLVQDYLKNKSLKV
mmetsp:Transcript_2095/g.2997  ORF Transcript_2095/g.2997 Transcript_2095/m.2997 type:complete len:581 (+) Transcript_2095:145-1887(+)